MIRLILIYGPILIVFLTLLLAAVITTAAMPYLMIPALIIIGVAVLARYLFGPFR